MSDSKKVADKLCAVVKEFQDTTPPISGYVSHLAEYDSYESSVTCEWQAVINEDDGKTLIQVELPTNIVILNIEQLRQMLDALLFLEKLDESQRPLIVSIVSLLNQWER